MQRSTITKLKSFRILFEKVSNRDKINWTTVEGCIDCEDAIDYFRQTYSFEEYEIIQIKEIYE